MNTTTSSSSLVLPVPAPLAGALRIGVLGFAQQGASTLRFLRLYAPGVALLVADAHPREELKPELQQLLGDTPYAGGSGYLQALAGCNVIVKAAGVPPLPILDEYAAAGVRVITQSHLFFSLWQGRTIGVTGSKGKSTTSSMLAAMLRAQDAQPVWLMGNNDMPMLDYFAMEPGATGAGEVAVIEFSSFLLDGLDTSPDIALWTTMYPTHIDHHGTYAAYTAAKAHIYAHQRPGQWAVGNGQDALVAAMAAAHTQATGAQLRLYPSADVAWYDDEYVYYRGEKLARTEMQLVGDHNMSNACGALAVADICDVSAEAAFAALRGFAALPHRLAQHAVAGRIVVDDSISTTPLAAMEALKALRGRTACLVVGGKEAGVPQEELAASIVAHAVPTVLALPPTGMQLAASLRAAGYAGNLIELPDFTPAAMPQLAQLALQHTPVGMACVLSPAAPSTHMFADYKQRGDMFVSAMREAAGE